MSSSTKVKILVFGDIGGGGGTTGSTKNEGQKNNNNDEVVKLFLQKLTALQNSKAGPFDAAFVVGSTSYSSIAKNLLVVSESEGTTTSLLPLPVYLHHVIRDDTTTSNKKELHDVNLSPPMEPAKKDDNNNNNRDNDDANTSTSTTTKTQQPTQLAHNLYALLIPSDDGSSTSTTTTAGIWSLSFPNRPAGVELIVAACPPRIRTDDPQIVKSSLMHAIKHHVSYRGCDVLLSVEPPQGAEALLAPGAVVDGAVSFDVADVALHARARYHFFPSSAYQQSSPFSHVASSTTTAPVLHTGRLIALAPVSSSKDKAHKCVHALGMTPLLSMSTLELQQQQSGQVLPCPYTDASYHPNVGSASAQPNSSTTIATTTAGLSEASTRRILAEEQQKRSLDGSSRWIQPHHSKRQRSANDNSNQDDHVVDPANTTLFVHGLHKDVSGRLQSSHGNVLLVQAFGRWKPVRVRHPSSTATASTSSFCFVEFASHEDALQCLQDTGGEVTVAGVHLSLKWATHHHHHQSRDGHEATTHANKSRHPERLTEAQAKDSTTLYFKLVQFPHNETTGDAMRVWSQAILEAALNEGVTSDEDRVTAKDEPALRVEVRIMEAFGFLDFASHAAASMVIATLTGSVDGGQVVLPAEQQDPNDETQASSQSRHRPDLLQEAVTIYVRWAHTKASHSDAHASNNVIEDASGFKFERKHFPADSRQDCWFCLASESCEKHLITGVYDQCYAAMPKGPVHPGHVLLIPVQHSSQGALKDPQVSLEMDNLKAKLRDHASSAYDCDLFVFERAIQTRGGYHTHVQCIPVERQLGQRLLTTMMAQASKTGMNLKEIKSDIAASTLLADDDEHDNDENGGYFYAEIPFASGCRRFLHRQVPSGRQRGGSVPLQFGREILAAVLGKPDLAHWKSCLLDKEQETKLALDFRESFAKLV